MMRCNICQRVPQHPVVSVKSGYIFERSLIEKYIEEHGRCPVTGEPLRVEELVSVRGATPDTSVSSSGSLGAASVPTLLERLQAEWEGMALEQFTLRQQVTQMQQEVAHALQQYDAACRVIAKLSKEVAVLRGDGTSGAAEVNGDGTPAVVVSAAVLSKLDEVEASVRKERKQRKAAAAASPAPLAFAEEAQWALSLSQPSAVRVATSVEGGSVYTSQATGDHAVVLYGLRSRAEEGRGVGHAASVHTITTAAEVALSASEDGTVRVWTWTGSALQCAHTLRYADGVAAMSRRTVGGSYVLCGAPDGSLYLSDIEQGSHVVTTAPVVRSSPGLACVELHPYASLAAVVLPPADVQLWDTRAMAANTVIALPRDGAARCTRVTSASFSADCVSLAAGLSDGSAYVWDLRHVAAPVAVLPPNAESIPATVRYSVDGRTLAVAGAGISLYASPSASTASAAPALTVGATGSAVCDLTWSADGTGFVSGSVDGVVRVYAASA